MGGVSLPKRALSASATCPAGTAGIEAVVVVEFGAWEGDCAGGDDGTGRLLGPKISPRVAGMGDIRLVDGVAEKSEFCASAGVVTATSTGTRARHNWPRRTPIANSPFMTWFFSAEIEAISSQPPRCLLPR